MKKQLLLICFLMAAVAGFSQMNKADAVAFLARNPVEGVNAVNLWEGAEKSTWTKEAVVSLKAMESGFSLVTKSEVGDLEKFIPYAALKYIARNSSNNLNFVLLD